MPSHPPGSPLVSVVISVFGDVADLPTTVETVLAQTLQDFEIVLVDDGNDAEGKAMIRELADRDRRIRVIANEANMGLTKSLIRGCNAARGAYIARIDNSDLMVPRTRLETQAQLLQNDSGLVLVGGACEIVDALNLRRFRTRAVQQSHDEIVAQPRDRAWFKHASVLFSKRAYDAAGGYSPAYPVGQDAELWPRLLQQGKGRNLAETFAITPMRETSISAAQNNVQIRAKMKKILKYKYSYITILNYGLKVWKIILQIGKLSIPIRYRVLFRHLKQCEYLGRIPKQYCFNSNEIRNFYTNYFMDT